MPTSAKIQTPWQSSHVHPHILHGLNICTLISSNSVLNVDSKFGFHKELMLCSVVVFPLKFWYVCFYSSILASLANFKPLALSCSHPVHVKEEPTEVEEDCRPICHLASVTHSLPLPSDVATLRRIFLPSWSRTGVGPNQESRGKTQWHQSLIGVCEKEKSYNTLMRKERKEECFLLLFFF